MPWMIRAAKEADAEGISELSVRVYGRPFSAQEQRWKYARPGAGCAASFVVEHEGPIIFHYGGVFGRYDCRDRDRLGVVAVDAMTDPRFRRQDLLTEGTAHAWSAWRDAGAAFVLGLPNSNHGSQLQAAGWRPLLELPRRIRPLQLGRFLRRRGSVLGSLGLGDVLAHALRALWRPRGTAAVSVLELEAGAVVPELGPLPHLAQLRRSPEWLTWRFSARPGVRYRLFVARDGGQDAAYLVLRQREEGGRRYALVADCLAPSSDRALAAAVTAASERAFSDGCEKAEVHLSGGPATQVLARQGFWFRRRPAPVRLAPLVDDLPVALLDGRNWYLTGADFDLV